MDAAVVARPGTVGVTGVWRAAATAATDTETAMQVRRGGQPLRLFFVARRCGVVDSDDTVVRVGPRGARCSHGACQAARVCVCCC
jgi:hypothetical protein